MDQMYMAAAEQEIERYELKLCAMFARIGIPVMVVIFQIVYWTIGKISAKIIFVHLKCQIILVLSNCSSYQNCDSNNWTFLLHSVKLLLFIFFTLLFGRAITIEKAIQIRSYKQKIKAQRYRATTVAITVEERI